MKLQQFTIEVWFRYISFGEQEKEHEFHDVEAISLLDAVAKVNGLYKSKTAIPFAYYHNNIKIQ